MYKFLITLLAPLLFYGRFSSVFTKLLSHPSDVSQQPHLEKELGKKIVIQYKHRWIYGAN